MSVTTTTTTTTTTTYSGSDSTAAVAPRVNGFSVNDDGTHSGYLHHVNDNDGDHIAGSSVGSGIHIGGEEQLPLGASLAKHAAQVASGNATGNIGGYIHDSAVSTASAGNSLLNKMLSLIGIHKPPSPLQNVPQQGGAATAAINAAQDTGQPRSSGAVLREVSHGNIPANLTAGEANVIINQLPRTKDEENVPTDGRQITEEYLQALLNSGVSDKTKKLAYALLKNFDQLAQDGNPPSISSQTLVAATAPAEDEEDSDDTLPKEFDPSAAIAKKEQAAAKQVTPASVGAIEQLISKSGATVDGKVTLQNLVDAEYTLDRNPNASPELKAQVKELKNNFQKYADKDGNVTESSVGNANAVDRTDVALKAAIASGQIPPNITPAVAKLVVDQLEDARKASGATKDGKLTKDDLKAIVAPDSKAPEPLKQTAQILLDQFPTKADASGNITADSLVNASLVASGAIPAAATVATPQASTAQAATPVATGATPALESDKANLAQTLVRPAAAFYDIEKAAGTEPDGQLTLADVDAIIKNPNASTTDKAKAEYFKAHFSEIAGNGNSATPEQFANFAIREIERKAGTTPDGLLGKNDVEKLPEEFQKELFKVPTSTQAGDPSGHWMRASDLLKPASLTPGPSPFGLANG